MSVRVNRCQVRKKARNLLSTKSRARTQAHISTPHTVYRQNGRQLKSKKAKRKPSSELREKQTQHLYVSLLSPACGRRRHTQDTLAPTCVHPHHSLTNQLHRLERTSKSLRSSALTHSEAILRVTCACTLPLVSNICLCFACLPGWRRARKKASKQSSVRPRVRGCRRPEKRSPPSEEHKSKARLRLGN